MPGSVKPIDGGRNGALAHFTDHLSTEAEGLPGIPSEKWAIVRPRMHVPFGYEAPTSLRHEHLRSI